jgi:hypothetical protein
MDYEPNYERELAMMRYAAKVRRKYERQTVAEYAMILAVTLLGCWILRLLTGL